MQDSAHFQRLVDAAVQQAFDDARADLTMRVMNAIAPAFAPRNDTQRLAAAVGRVETAFAQTEILGALLTACSEFATRCALLVARGVSAPVWQSSGFDASALKGVTAQVAAGLGATAMQTLTRTEGDAKEFDEHFISIAGSPANGKCVVLPLLVREKVAALIYADAGHDGSCDADALEILVRAAGSRIEIAATRKPPIQTMAAAASAASPAQHLPVPAPVPPVPVTALPSAPVAAAPAMAPVPAVAPAAPVSQAPAPVAPSHVPQAHPTHAPAASAPAQLQDEVHVKARRFAKLLVDEIKLYNQQEVANGKAASDLYGRLREPIDKSREAYDKRYGATTAASGNYFAAELVRILADNNIALMGPNFPR